MIHFSPLSDVEQISQALPELASPMAQAALSIAAECLLPHRRQALHLDDIKSGYAVMFFHDETAARAAVAGFAAEADDFIVDLFGRDPSSGCWRLIELDILAVDPE